MTRNQQVKAYEMAKTRLSKSLKAHSDLTRRCDHYEEMLTSLRGDDSKTVGLMVRGHGEVGYSRETMLIMLGEEFRLATIEQEKYELALIAAAQQLNPVFVIPMPNNEQLAKEYDTIMPVDHPLPEEYVYVPPHVLPAHPDPNTLYPVTISGWKHVETYMLGDLIMVRTGELPSGQEKGINKFMRGQTRPTVLNEKTQDFIYLWDYERYLKSAGNDASE